jgi:hypothetical protein
MRLQPPAAGLLCAFCERLESEQYDFQYQYNLLTRNACIHNYMFLLVFLPARLDLFRR